MDEAETREVMAGGGFDLGRVAAIADALPMLVALVDPELRYRFCNKALADFFERRRSQILGRTVREVVGEKAYADREPMLAAALRGERQWFAASFDHPSRGPIAVQTEYLPQLGPDGHVDGVVIIVQDVTEQRVAERALRESEARFRRIANSAPVIMWVTRLDGHREFVNDAYLDFAGIDRDQVNSHEWRDWIYPDDFMRIVAESQAGEASREPFTLEGRYRRADGEWRWLRSVSSPRFGPDEELIGFIGAAFDITPAKLGEIQLKAEVEARTAALSASESRFRAVFDTALEMISLLSVDGDYLEVNRTALETMGVPGEALIGRKAWELPPIAGNPNAGATIRSLIAAGAAGLTSTAEIQVTIGGERQTHVTSDRKSTRLNSSHTDISRMPSSA